MGRRSAPLRWVCRNLALGWHLQQGVEIEAEGLISSSLPPLHSFFLLPPHHHHHHHHHCEFPEETSQGLVAATPCKAAAGRSTQVLAVSCVALYAPLLEMLLLDVCPKHAKLQSCKGVSHYLSFPQPSPPP